MIADLTHRAKFRLSGPDRIRYLNGQVTNNVARLRIGETAYALVANHKGRLEGDVFIHARADDFLIDADRSLRDSLFARLGKYLIADDCELTDVTGDFALIHELVDPDRPDSPAATLAFAVERFGVPGRDVWLPASAPRPAADISDDDLDLLRLEHAVPVWGAELTPDVLPQEPRLDDRAVDFHKGCYVGQEVISRLRSVGHVNRELHALDVTEGELRPGDHLFSHRQGGPTAGGSEGEWAAVGVVTSARFHPQRKKAIALGYVKRTFAVEGAVFRAGLDATHLTSTVNLRITAAPSRLSP